MKRLPLILAMVAVACTVVGCGSNPSGSNDESFAQVAMVWAYYARLDWDEEQGQYVVMPHTSIGGVIVGDPVPTFEHVRVNGLLFSGDPFCTYEQGYIAFGNSGWDTEDIVILSDLGQLAVDVETSFGGVSGSVPLPDSIDYVLIDPSGAIDVGQSLTVTWFGGDADYCYLALLYRWQDQDDSLHYEYADTVTISQSVTIDGSFFSHDGEIYGVSLCPANGPFPGAGARPNMTGSGCGYLYYSTDSKWLDLSIDVGNGITRPQGILRMPERGDVMRRAGREVVRRLGLID